MENIEKITKLNKNSRIGVLCGGLSNEREVSLRSGRNVFRALIELGYKDVTLVDVDRNIASVLVENKIEYAINVFVSISFSSSMRRHSIERYARSPLSSLMP